MRRGRPPDSPEIALSMLIDTGADRTIVDTAKIALLNVPPLDVAHISGVHGTPRTYMVYSVELVLGMSDRPFVKGKDRPATTLFGFGTRLVGMPRLGDLDGVLGRDFLMNFDFRYF